MVGNFVEQGLQHSMNLVPQSGIDFGPFLHDPGPYLFAFGSLALLGIVVTGVVTLGMRGSGRPYRRKRIL